MEKETLAIKLEFIELYKKMFVATMEYNQHEAEAFQKFMESDPFLPMENEPEEIYKWATARAGSITEMPGDVKD